MMCRPSVPTFVAIVAVTLSDLLVSVAAGATQPASYCNVVTFGNNGIVTVRNNGIDDYDSLSSSSII